MRSICFSVLVVAALSSACGIEPQPFAPGVISRSESHDDYLTFAPDGGRIFFTRLTDDYRRGTIYVSDRTREGWSEPAVAWFSGRFNDSRPFVSPDGRRLFFASNRPRPGDAGPDQPREDLDLWVVDLTRDGAPAENLGAPVNTDANETHPSIAANGDLYFPVWGPGRSNDIYVARAVPGGFSTPERLSEAINTPQPDSHPYIDPEQRFLLFARIPDRERGDDIYLALRNPDGSWQEAQPLPAPLNGALYEYSAKVDPAGEWLYFSRTDFGPGGRKADLFRVPLREVQPLAAFAR